MTCASTIDDSAAIIDYGMLLCVLTASPDAEGCLNEMNRVCWLIVEHARAIQNREVAKHVPAMRLTKAR
jgi:hypothetical protein